MSHLIDRDGAVSVLERRAQQCFDGYDWGGRSVFATVSRWIGDALGSRWTRVVALNHGAGEPDTVMFVVLLDPLDLTRAQVVAAFGLDVPHLVGVPQVFDRLGRPIGWLKSYESAFVALRVGHTCPMATSIRPRLALMKCTRASLGRLLRMWLAVNILRASELRAVDAPVWWPLNVEEEMRLEYHEVVVTASGHFRFSGVPEREQDQVQTNDVDLQILFDTAYRHIGGMGAIGGMDAGELAEVDLARQAILDHHVFFAGA
jgi:hypothetical protein